MRNAAFVAGILLCSGCFASSPSHLLRAEELRARGKFEAAIAEYQAYIDERLEKQDFTDQDTPYFFYLLIGDSYLGLEDIPKAEEAYVKAKDNGTAVNLVAGKLRGIAQWYEVRGRYADAIDLLQRYRQLDPLLFDLDIDRNHKSLISSEDALRNEQR